MAKGHMFDGRETQGVIKCYSVSNSSSEKLENTVFKKITVLAFKLL